MIEVYPYEAWCAPCQVSYPPGTKRCLHCGGGVMPMRPVESMRSAAPLSIRSAGDGPAPPDLVADESAGEGAEASRAARPFRIGLTTIWIVLAVLGAILRTCAERG